METEDKFKECLIHFLKMFRHLKTQSQDQFIAHLQNGSYFEAARFNAIISTNDAIGDKLGEILKEYKIDFEE